MHYFPLSFFVGRKLDVGLWFRPDNKGYWPPTQTGPLADWLIIISLSLLTVCCCPIICANQAWEAPSFAYVRQHKLEGSKLHYLTRFSICSLECRLDVLHQFPTATILIFINPSSLKSFVNFKFLGWENKVNLEFWILRLHVCLFVSMQENTCARKISPPSQFVNFQVLAEKRRQ